jgi:hypothetical protein
MTEENHCKFGYTLIGFKTIMCKRFESGRGGWIEDSCLYPFEINCQDACNHFNSQLTKEEKP